MLIEDISVSISGLSLDARVVNASWSFQLNSLSNATISIEANPSKSVVYREIFTYNRTLLVGTTIQLFWTSNNNMLLYEGIVTGISLSKTINNVAYSITAAGGPTAFYNTTLATKGWWPFGSYSNAAVAALFRSKIIETEWNTPKTLIETMVPVLLSPQLFDPKLHSHAAKNQLELVTQDLNNDIAKLVEAPILNDFFGNVGDFTQHGAAIRRRLQDLISGNMGDLTYWSFLLALCAEIGVTVVPFISKTFLVPNMLFTDPPQCNVLFPSLLTGTNVVSEPMEYPDQIIMSTQMGLAQDIDIVMRDLYETTAYVYPETEPTDQFSPYAGNRYLVVPPQEYRYLEYIAYEQLRKAQAAQQSKSADETKEDITPTGGVLAAEIQANHKEYCKNFADYYYHKIRSEKDYGQVSAAFQPLVVPGFGSYIIDGQEGMNYRGVVTRADHSITETSASSSFSFSYLASIDEQVTFIHPLWQQLVPTGDNTSQILLEEPSMAINSKVNHIPFEQTLLTQKENEDAKLAAIYTGRISE